MPARVKGPRARLALFALLLLGAILSAGCALALPQSTLHPAGDVARMQQGLFLYIFWIAVGIFVVVEALLLIAVVRFRQRRGRERDVPRQVHGNTSLEIAWTLAPAIIVVAVTIPTVINIAPTYEPPADQAGLAEAIDVEVIGHQWWWEYRYLDPRTKEVDFVTASEMHIPVNAVVRLTLTSGDVIHSFSVPRLAGTRDAFPGRVNRMWFRATETGEFPGQCKELCGLSHARMRALVIAEPRQEFEAWAGRQRAAAVVDLVAPAVEQGWSLFQSKGCIGCHTIRGTDKAVGKVGPDLTHFGSRGTIAAVAFRKDAANENLRTWLQDPPAVKPGSLMPNLRLSEGEIGTLVAFLQGLQ